MDKSIELTQLKLELAIRTYRAHPELYVEQVLGRTITPAQRAILRAVRKHDKVMVAASHGIGKTFICGSLVNWHFDCFKPGITLTTAPTESQVKDLLWKEVRTQRKDKSVFSPRAPRMETAPDHFAAGYTAKSSDAFQGRHEEYVLIVFDEGVGVASDFWDASEGMMTGDNCIWVVIFNPTNTNSRAYQESLTGDWHVIHVSALDHPNIHAELRGDPPPFPAAVRLKWVLGRIKRWCKRLGEDEIITAKDFEFPPGSGEWYRPNVDFETRVLGRWPSSATNALWDETVCAACDIRQEIPDECPEIGCDVARFGNDETTIFVRQGPVLLHAESHGKSSTTFVAERLRALAEKFAGKYDPKEVPVKIDDSGVGGGVTDQAFGYNFIPVNGAEVADQSKYPNRRSEAWFVASELANERQIDWSRIDEEIVFSLKRELKAPTWKLDNAGRRVVESKEIIKKRIKRSTDYADGFNLAYYRPAVAWHKQKGFLDKLKARWKNNV
jgi:hypothetical protein